VAGDVSAHFSDDGRAAVAAATAAARDGNAAEVTSEHLLAGVLRHADGELTHLLSPYGLTAETSARRILPGRPADPVVEAPAFSARVKEILRIANATARQDGGRIGCASIFLALMLRRDSAVMAYLRDKAEVDRLTSAARALTER
jgi:ATP-dependent Clp protease ATP-binding subunit ClpA